MTAILITPDRAVAELAFPACTMTAKGAVIDAALGAPRTLDTTYITYGVHAWHAGDAALPANDLATALARRWGIDRAFHGPVLLLDGPGPDCDPLASDTASDMLADLAELALDPIADELPAGVLADLIAKGPDPHEPVREQLGVAAAALVSGDEDAAREIEDEVRRAVLNVIANRRVAPDVAPALARHALATPIA